MPTFQVKYLGQKINLNRHGYRNRWYGVNVVNSIGARAYLGSADSKKEGIALGQRFIYDWKYNRR